MSLTAARALFSLVLILAVGPLCAGQFRLQVGQANRVPVGIEVRNAETQCNVEISVEGGPTVQQRVRAPDFLAWLVLVPAKAGPVQVSWRGVFYRDEKDELFNACPTMGQTRFMATSLSADLQADWQAFWSSIGDLNARCMQASLQAQGLGTQGFDRRDPAGSVMDRILARTQQQCERFAAIKTPWGNDPMLNHACQIDGRKTRCDGYYMVQGQPKAGRLNFEQAVQQHRLGATLVAQRAESLQAVAARARAEQAARAKAEAEELARLEAFKKALAEQKKREEAEQALKLAEAEAERQRQIKAAEQREREWLENRPWLVRKLSRIQPKPLEEDAAKDDKPQQEGVKK